MIISNRGPIKVEKSVVSNEHVSSDGYYFLMLNIVTGGSLDSL